jgi:hypothetical protein
MAAEVVHDDNVAGREDRDENLLDISAEAHAIDRSVHDAGRGEAVATQSRQEGEGPPFAEGRFGDEALTSGGSAVGARHVGFGPGLVDEDQSPRIDRRLTRLPSRLRRLATSGRSCSEARRLFFERHAFMLEKMPKRGIAHHQAAVGQLLKQSAQREIRLPGDPR